MLKNKIAKRIVWASGALIASLVIVMVVCDRMVDHAAKGRIYDDVEDVPLRKVGLVLGTSPISTWNGRRNYYFDHRIKSGGREVLARVKLFIDIAIGVQPDIKESMVCDFTKPKSDFK